MQRGMEGRKEEKKEGRKQRRIAATDEAEMHFVLMSIFKYFCCNAHIANLI